MTSYEAFLAAKAQLGDAAGFEPNTLPDHLFGFQQHLTAWAVRQGRAAIFADCGLGKTPMQLTWGENVHRHTGKPVLLLTPLAVSFQTEGKARKFGMDAAVSRDGSVPAPITVTNYERLEHFDPDRFGGVVCDESSALKSFDGKTRAQVTEFMRTLPYRLLCTATAAPNDYIELGTSSEALGHLGHMDMLARFFTNKDRSAKAIGGRWRSTSTDKWRLKGHAEVPFWRWVTSWARAAAYPLPEPDQHTGTAAYWRRGHGHITATTDGVAINGHHTPDVTGLEEWALAVLAAIRTHREMTAGPTHAHPGDIPEPLFEIDEEAS